MNRVVAISSTLIYLSITVVGWFGNGCIILATILCRKLHGPCNILISVESFCELFHQSAHVITAYFVLSRNYFITSDHCFVLQMTPNLFMNIGNFLNLCIGIDRLFSVIFPFFYLRMNKLIYVILMVTPAMCYGTSLMAITYVESDFKFVVCSIAAIYTGKARYIFDVTASALNIMIVLTYIVLWLILYKKKAIYTTKLVRSVTIMVMITICGWLSTMITFSLNTIFSMTGLLSFYTILVAGVFVNITVSSNFFVLYYCSIEYRLAFKSIMKLQRPIETSGEIFATSLPKRSTKILDDISKSVFKSDTATGGTRVVITHC